MALIVFFLHCKRGGGGGGGGGIGYQVADTGPVGWVNFWPGCSLVPGY